MSNNKDHLVGQLTRPDLALGTHEGEVEAHRRGRLQI